MTAKKKLGELLVDTGLLSPSDLERALGEQQKRKARLGEVIVELGLATEEEIAHALSVQLGVPVIDLTETPVEPEALDLIPEKVARKHLIMPIGIDRGCLHIAMADPLSFEAFEDVRFASGYTIRASIATRSQALWAIDHHYHLGSSISEIVKDISREKVVEIVQEGDGAADRDIDDLRKKSEAAPIIRMVNLVFAEAVALKASDIHIEPAKSALQIRNRVDGHLRKSLDLPKWVQGAIISRIKVMAKMDISEKRLPQDGRISVRVGEKLLDLRVSTLPAAYGEKVVIRVLDTAAALIPLEAMGLVGGDLPRMEALIQAPHGIVLVTGPTGSGKTTTLYAMLNRLRNVETNITTIEDPIEYDLPGVNQVAVQEKIGLTFANSLRALLRQDPDVVMVGEMRDLETATIAMQAALTGHLVLSTVHTNSAAATVTRLRNLGLPSYLVASTILGVVAQRLVRVVCPSCRVEDRPDPGSLERLGMSSDGAAMFYRGAGCASCGGTGYKGRTGIYEILPFTPAIRDLVASDGAESDIRRTAIAQGMTTLTAAVAEKVRRGVTTFSEAYNLVDVLEKTSASCPACGKGVGPDFAACPHCGHSLAENCPSCFKIVSTDWKFCPYCRYDFLPAKI